jgi:hypothetical protein
MHFRRSAPLSIALSCLAVAGGLASPSQAVASPAPQPVLRHGSCPSGFYSSGDYCVPGSGARFALARNGSCPSGYFSSGNYCVASSDSSRLAIPRSGSCPSGYFSSGQYCVSNR